MDDNLQPGLYIVATPIGNLGDITLRAIEVLKRVEAVACEDTRVTGKLLHHLGIRKRMIRYDDHASEADRARLLDLMRGGPVALVSDAGTPLVSDPGFRLVRAAQEKGLRVVPVPGASAVLAALTASGLATDSFLFGGFLPSKAGQRAKRLETLATVPATLLFFESPRRLAQSLRAMAETLGERQAVVARELTKAFEEVRRGTLAELADHYEETGSPRGEVVVCVASPGEAGPTDAGETDRLLLALSAEMSASKAAGEAARMTGGRKSDLYQRLLVLKDVSDDG